MRGLGMSRHETQKLKSYPDVREHNGYKPSTEEHRSILPRIIILEELLGSETSSLPRNWTASLPSKLSLGLFSIHSSLTFLESLSKKLERVLSTSFRRNQLNYKVRFQVPTAASIKMAVFWDVAPYSLVEVYRRFRGVCCLPHQGDRDLQLNYKFLQAL
jgi:hypothetical protein